MILTLKEYAFIGIRRQGLTPRQAMELIKVARRSEWAFEKAVDFALLTVCKKPIFNVQ